MSSTGSKLEHDDFTYHRQYITRTNKRGRKKKTVRESLEKKTIQGVEEARESGHITYSLNASFLKIHKEMGRMYVRE